MAALTALFIAAFILAGLLVDQAIHYISPERELAIFQTIKIDRNVFPEDPPASQALQTLASALADCAQISVPIQAHIVPDPAINALALPGGHIVVFSGLLRQISSENGLAFVVAHELAHFRNRDHLAGLGRGLVITAMAAYLTGSRSGLTRILAPGFSLGQAQYSQSRELLADKDALDTLACHYKHAGGATEFFQSLQHTKGSSHLPAYLASHPDTADRIAAITQHIAAYDLPLQTPQELNPILRVAGEAAR